MSQKPIRQAIESAMNSYLDTLNGERPAGVYKLVVGEVEAALLKTIMEYAEHNQSHAAEYLGLNRGTLRKKLKEHKLL